LRIETWLAVELAALVQGDGRIVRRPQIRARETVGKEITQRSSRHDFKTVGLIHGRRGPPTQTVGRCQVLFYAPNILTVEVIFLRRERALRTRAGGQDLPVGTIKEVCGVGRESADECRERIAQVYFE